MSVIYVLILWSDIYGGYAVAMQEFTSKEACEFAIQQIQKTDKETWLDGQIAICVPK